MSSLGAALRPAPRFLMGATLIAWGWQNGFLAYAVVMTLILEGASWIGWRWPISDREFNAVSDLSSVVFAAVVIYVFTTRGAMGIFLILALLPFIFFLLIFTQVYSEAGSVRLSALFISLRRLQPEISPEAGKRLDLTLPYCLTSLISASAGNRMGNLFFLVSAAVIGAILWTLRPARVRLRSWAVLALLTLLLGYVGQVGIVRLQSAIESSVLQVMERFMGGYRFRNSSRAMTAIGSIGRLQLSDRIMLRVKTDHRLASPLLLREAAYDTYGYGIWTNRHGTLTQVDPDLGGGWTLQRGNAPRHLTVAMYFPERTAVIPVPQSVMHIGGTGATALSRNPYGALKMEFHKGWVSYRAGYGDGSIDGAPPEQADLYITGPYRADFERLASQLRLKGMDAAAAVKRVEQYFAHGFTYSLTQKQRYPRGRYLANFLFHTHKGHCEFFATATVLLLRAAGVPARYAVGYVVEEYSSLEHLYLVRGRHAHSWVLAWVNGSWRSVDTTPPAWSALGNDEVSPMESLFDVWSWIDYKLSTWRSENKSAGNGNNDWMLWLLGPLLLILAWRLFSKKRIALPPATTAHRYRRDGPGKDSDFYRIVTELETRGLMRRPGETLSAWLKRHREILRDSPIYEALALHYRYRFDPTGLTHQERQLLEQRVEDALRSLTTAA